mmetsp:Transcript_75768/g.175686  ORF Transcript_75768/g.175686 Transcript_75768/m.175686 type:complete len:175 (+) Transcript_75768:629-1153(+)
MSDVSSEMFEPNSPEMVTEMLRQLRHAQSGGAPAAGTGTGAGRGPGGGTGGKAVAEDTRLCGSAVVSNTHADHRKTLKMSGGAPACEAADELVGRTAASAPSCASTPDASRRTAPLQRRLPPGLADGQPPRRLTMFTGAGGRPWNPTSMSQHDGPMDNVLGIVAGGGRPGEDTL